MDARDEVRQVMHQISEAWRKGKTEQLRDLFHADIVIVGPGYQELRRGRDACVSSYEDFLRHATIHAYTEAELKVDVWGDTAVAHYAWQMTYQAKGDPTTERGTDLFVFTREGSAWKAVWRALQAATPKQ